LPRARVCFGLPFPISLWLKKSFFLKRLSMPSSLLHPAQLFAFCSELPETTA
jgi:hypothetical protein